MEFPPNEWPIPMTVRESRPDSFSWRGKWSGSGADGSEVCGR
jgi:hypothetical protein